MVRFAVKTRRQGGNYKTAVDQYTGKPLEFPTWTDASNAALLHHPDLVEIDEIAGTPGYRIRIEETET